MPWTEALQGGCWSSGAQARADLDHGSITVLGHAADDFDRHRHFPLAVPALEHAPKRALPHEAENFVCRIASECQQPASLCGGTAVCPPTQHRQQGQAQDALRLSSAHVGA